MIQNNGFENLTWYMGIVENNDDPTHAGRIQVRWIGIHPIVASPDVLTEDLPWALVVNGTGGKFFSVPDNGDWVIGCFLDGRDAQHPVVFGVINGMRSSLPSTGAGPASANPVGRINPLGGSTNAEKAYNYFISQGFTPEQAAGIVGNLQAESGKNLDPAAFNPAGGGQGAAGIAQWRGPRQEVFEQRYGKPVTSATLEEQLDYIMYEFNTTETRAYSGVSGASTIEEAAVAFDNLFERSGGGSISARVSNAESIFDLYSTNETSIVDDSSNDFLAPSQDAVNNYGRPPLPPQMTGEDLDQTPMIVHSSTKGESDPGIPVGGSINSSVWQTTYGGTAIELSGKNGYDEFLNITHASGSVISIDQHGSILIKSVGNIEVLSEGNQRAASPGSKNQHFGEGYDLTSEAELKIHSIGNMSITTNGDLSLAAGGKISVNASEGLDLSGAKISVLAEVEGIDVLSANDIAITAGAKMDIKSGDTTTLQSSGKTSLKAGGMIAADGSEIHLDNGMADSAADSSPVVPATRMDKLITNPTKTVTTPIALSGDMGDYA